MYNELKQLAKNQSVMQGKKDLHYKPNNTANSQMLH